ncbi:Uncharacterised protein [Shigella sonnei]|uniref:hypothetical protein n=1 Tax=Enterobacteriaceae TaxID=543 RepID=UPI000DA56B98|nr:MULTISPECIES: hypothetical protein [Enterobacteriaceae]MCO7957692.1 hypothetical protein [Escherichia coli]SRI45959.1 Uncharacterised protein [Shigella sonnei]
MIEERLETIRSVCERLQLQPNRQKLRIKNKHHVFTSHKPKTRKIPKWCIDRIPSDAQVIGETELHYLVRH